MAWDLILWILCVLIIFALLAMVFHQLLCLTDLEAHKMNPFEATAQINQWTLPEFLLQGAISLLFLVTGHWVMFLMAVPLTCYHVMLFMKRKHLIDVTEVFRNLHFDKKYRMMKLGFYLLSFTIFLYRFIADNLPLYNSEDLDFRSSILEF